MFNDEYFDTQKICNDKSIPIMRIIARLDKFENKNDPAGAEKHLLYWIEEAEKAGDKRGEFAVKNELMGLYRNMGKRDEAITAAESTLAIGREIGMECGEAFGTALLNAATVYKAFGENKKASSLFEKAAQILSGNLAETAPKMGGLYNNMALNLTDLDKFDEAEAAYKKAIDIMMKNEYGELESAISWLNLANMYEKRDGLENGDEEISACLEKAQCLLETPSLPRNGYYAFVCEKCAPTFLYYGRFYFAAELEKAAKEIYERNRA